MSKCVVAGCERAPVFPDQSRCEVHRLRWRVIEGGRPDKPEWLRRMQRVGLPAKDYTGSAA